MMHEILKQISFARLSARCKKILNETVVFAFDFVANYFVVVLNSAT